MLIFLGRECLISFISIPQATDYKDILTFPKDLNEHCKGEICAHS